MAKFRFLALQEIARRKPVECGERPRCSVVFGENVFSMDKMRHYLSIEAYKKLEKAMSEGLAIDRGLADQVAAAMKAWAVERGVTHYTHWFHPLNGATAEKHDSFIDLLGTGSSNVKVIGIDDGATFVNNYISQECYAVADIMTYGGTMDEGHDYNVPVPAYLSQPCQEAVNYYVKAN